MALAPLRDTAIPSCSASTALQSATPKESADEQVISCSHTLRGIGTYRQLASFFGSINSARGLAAVDGMEMLYDADVGAGKLVASVDVVWYAPGPTSAFESTEVSE